MKVFNKVVILFCLNFHYSYAQFNELKVAPEVSIEYNKGIHLICTANIFKINGVAGSMFIGMDNFGIGLGLSIRDGKTIPEAILNYSKTYYIFDFGIRSKLSLNSNEKFFVVSPTIGISMFGFFGAFYSYNLGNFSPNYMSNHAIGCKFLISKILYK